MKIAAALLLTSMLAMSGCAVGPDYKMPSLDLPEFWHSPAPEAPKAIQLQVDQEWWKSFGDDTLNALITRALANNQDRKIAAARIVEARGARQSAASDFYPKISGSAQANRSDEGLLTFNQKQTLYQPEFDASYELDLFGGTRRQVEAQDANIGAQEAAYRDVTRTLTAEVARSYIDWRQLQQQLALTRDTANAQEKLFAITRAQFNAGTVSTFDVSQASMLYKNTVARIPDIERQLQASGYSLSVLLGETPGALNDELKDIKPLPTPTAIAGLDAPAQIITQRPDVEHAERQLAAATALHGVAISDMYPKITLSALFGVQHTNLAESGPIWSIGAGLVAPILNFGQIEGEIKSADARQVQAFHTYRQTVLQALSEVETNLSNINKENQRRLALRDATASANHALAMATSRYKDGISDFTEVLQTQQQGYTTKTDLVISEANNLQYLIALYKALGLGSIVPES